MIDKVDASIVITHTARYSVSYSCEYLPVYRSTGFADMVELVDTVDSKSTDLRVIRVQISLSALLQLRWFLNHELESKFEYLNSALENVK